MNRDWFTTLESKYDNDFVNHCHIFKYSSITEDQTFVSILTPRLGLIDCSIILIMFCPDCSAVSRVFESTAIPITGLLADSNLVVDKGKDAIFIGAPFVHQR